MDFRRCCSQRTPRSHDSRGAVYAASQAALARPRHIAVHAAWLIAFVVGSATPSLARAAEWEVIAEREGVVVSRRVVEGRAFPELRAVGDVPGTPYEVLAVLLDVPAQVHWRPDCVVSRVVRKTDAWRSIVYTRSAAPWPVADREVVIDNEVVFIKPPSKLKVTYAAIAAPEVNISRGAVRMTQARGFYEIEAIDATRSHVHYEMDIDPGGRLPGWLIAWQSTRNPMETLAGLRRRLEATRGRYDAQISRFPLASPE